MKIEDFWNKAFLAALTRLSPEEAKLDADRATEICINHWRANAHNYSPANFPRVQDVDIAHVRIAAKDGVAIPGSFGLITNKIVDS